jgi:LPXTG-motif cell wall-anchored protein
VVARLLGVIRAVVALVTGLTVCAAVPATAQEEEPELRTTAAFGKPSYVTTDQDVRFTVTVANTGTAAATDVHVEVTTQMHVEPAELEPLTTPRALAPGEEFSVEVTATTWPVEEPLRAHLVTWANGAPLGDGLDIEAPMTVLRGTVRGIVYGDLDGDEVVDPGEELVGGVVTIGGGVPYVFMDVRIGPGGAFTVPDLPVGHYTLFADLPYGWEVTTQPYYDLAGGTATWVVRAVRLVAPPTATITFDRARYAAGDPIRVRVTLTNPTAVTRTHVREHCDGEAPNVLSGAHWGELDPGVGVTLRPGETRTFDFADVVPPAAAEYGFVRVTCRAGADGSWLGPPVRATAAVPGRFGSVTGRVCRPGTDPCVPVPGVSLRLATGHALAGPDGRFRLTGVPAGHHEIRFAGPWRHAPGGDAYLQVLGDKTVDRRVDVVPGPVIGRPAAPVPPPARNVTTAAPVPTRLADTGANVGGLSAAGVLMVLTGAALVAVRRRDVH